MKKEVLVAIIIGFSLGLIVMIGVHTARKSLSKQAAVSPAGDSDQALALEQSGSLIEILSPLPNQIIEVETVSVRGTALADSMVAIITTNDEAVAMTDSQGNFEADLKLVTGRNVINVIAYDDTGQEMSTNVIIVQANKNLGATPTPNPTATPAPTAE
jgi:hypothetical protein